ncbi:Survival factor 1 [Smittium mucronatum]|uniref:Survival factor 1 n=1 Tax=Smittium mucronatum TaxID=133383 RepID=A0A1R0H7I5_9FUNG|nr:Survival factor 1 [Smittium mucronatum]
MFWTNHKTKSALSLVKEGSPVITETTKDDFIWLCKENGSETQSLYYKLNNGYFLFVQYAWARVSISTTFQTNFFLYRPNKPGIFETINQSTMDIGKDKLSVSGECLKIHWGSDMKEITFAYNNNKKDPEQKISLIATFKTSSKGYKIGEGKNHIAGGTALHAFLPAGSVESTLVCGNGETISDNGIGMFIRATSQHILPYNIGTDWSLSIATNNPSQNEFVFSFMHYKTPEKYGGVVISQGALIRRNLPAIYFYNNTVEYLELTKGLNKFYEIPKMLKITCHGITDDGKKASLIFITKNTTMFAEIDVLGQLNKIIKSFVQALVTRPYIFEFYEDGASLELQIEGQNNQTLPCSSFHELTMMK